MILLGTPGALAFDHDDITRDDPRKTATFYSSTAAIDQHLLKAYIILEQTNIHVDGTQIELGNEVSITGSYPTIHLQGEYHGLSFEFDLDVTNQALGLSKHLFTIILVFYRDLKVNLNTKGK